MSPVLGDHGGAGSACVYVAEKCHFGLDLGEIREELNYHFLRWVCMNQVVGGKPGLIVDGCTIH